MSAASPHRESTDDTLSALDAMFVTIEEANDPLHITATLVFEGDRLRNDHGRFDRARFEMHLQRALLSLPRLRQRLKSRGRLRRPVWIDDDAFDIARHIEERMLATPGTDADLRATVAAFQSRSLDRTRPLWSMLVIDGLEGGRIALVVKIHHAVLDGIAGVGALETLLGASDGVSPRRKHTPRGGRATLPDHWRASVRTALRGLFSAASVVARPSPRTLLNPVRSGPRRVVDWTSFDFAMLQRIAHEAGGTVNDVVLAITAGGLRRYLLAHHEPEEHLAMRVLVPVSTHDAAHATSGNAVSIRFEPLPCDEPDPRVRLDRIVRATREAKSTHQTEGVAWGEYVSNRTTPSLLSGIARIAMRLRPYNLIVTNVPGPAKPLDLFGARLLAVYPLVPLYGNQAIGLALLSYAGRMYCGVNADRDRVSDPEMLIEAMREAFVEMRETLLVPR